MYLTPKQIFIQDRISAGCDRDDVLWLADLEFTEYGEIRDGSILSHYQRTQ